MAQRVSLLKPKTAGKNDLPDNAITLGFEPGQIAKVDESDRLSIPVDLLRVVSWWNGETIDVMAELVGFGLVRIYSLNDAAPLIEQLIVASDKMARSARYERLMILKDRYRELTLYADGRLRIVRDVGSMLSTASIKGAVLFVQPFHNGLEIMTHEFRANRLMNSAETHAIGLHLKDLG